MKDSDVRQLLGKPRNVAARKTQLDTRSVWTYKQYYIENPVGYFFRGILTFGMLWIYLQIKNIITLFSAMGH